MNPFFRHTVRQLLCALLWLPLLVWAQTGTTPYRIGPDSSGAFINPHVDYFVDTSDSMDVTQVAQQAHFQSTQGKPGFGVTPHPIWLRFALQRNAGMPQQYKLEFLGINPARLDFHVARAGGFDTHTSGDFLPFSTRPLPYANYVYTVDLPDTAPLTVYMRMQRSGIQSAPLRIWTVDGWLSHALQLYLGYGLCLGVMFGLALYNLLLYLRLRDTVFALYCCTVLSYMLLAADYSGLTAQYLLPDALGTFPGRSGMIGANWGLWAALFSIHLLKFQGLPRWLERIFYACAGLYASVFVASPLGFTLYSAQVITLAPLFWFPLVLSLAAWRAWKKSLPALFYLLGFGPVLLGLILYIVNVRGQSDPSTFALGFFIFSGAWEAVLFSQALAQRVSEFKRAQEQATQQAWQAGQELAEAERRRINTDKLTGLSSRERLCQLGEEWLRLGVQPLVLVLNINRFKSINDVLGYANGDAALVATGRRLASIQEVTVGRLHANQFCLICEQPRRLQALQQRIEEIFSSPLSVGGHQVDITLSVGVAGEMADADMTQRIRNAEVALLAGRRTYKDWLAYDTSMESSHQDDLAFLSALRRAVECDQLQLYLQPKAHMQNGTTHSAEALVRWLHPERGLLFPDSFIAFAENTGCITLITRWVLREAMRISQRLRSAGAPLEISLNLSIHDLRDKTLAHTMAELLAETGALAADIRLEMTESVVMDDPDEMIALMHELNVLGFAMSVDDFGAGYSSLAYLQKMPVNELKIDRSFVSGAQPGSEAEVLLDSVILLGHRLGLNVVAEGVETAQEWQLLQRLGCDHAQGWLVAKAMPLEAFLQWRQDHPTWTVGRAGAQAALQHSGQVQP